MNEQLDKVVHPEKHRRWQRVWLTLLVIFVVLGSTVTGLVAYGNSYAGVVVPGLHIGNVPIGGMDREELKFFLQDMNDKLVTDGFHFFVKRPDGQTQDFVMYPVVATETTSYELLVIDIDAEVDRYIAYGKTGNFFTRAGEVLRARIQQPSIRVRSISAAEENILSTLSDYVSPFEQKAVNAGVRIDTVQPLVYEIVTSSMGIEYSYDGVVDQLIDSWSTLRSPQIELIPEVTEPSIHEPDVASIVSRLERVLDHNGLVIEFSDSLGIPHRWNITSRDVADWLDVQSVENDTFVFGLNKGRVQTFLSEKVSPDITVEAKDAKFQISGTGRVTEFQGSRAGVTLDVDATYDRINKAITDRTLHDEGIATTIQAAVKTVEPMVSTGEINDLGITEVLGTGVSSYAGSPGNRIKNIRNAVRKLNGVIIKPGEKFSAIEQTQPYTIEGGYLPELVIKGDEIKPEIGGGLCQIGTTLFRMAMRSGMPITERRNHSLVVNYYNDPSNGLPGTDATIYEPSPDFSFLNDTGHHVLVQTVMDESKQELRFTLWGTNDGRKGTYTPPVVQRWIGHGETKIIETTKLAPGVKECQHAYTGADASFTYTRTLADGTVENRIFESHYRPLPQICLVGIDPSAAPACPEGEECATPEPASESDSAAQKDQSEQLLSDLKQDGLIVLE